MADVSRTATVRLSFLCTKKRIFVVTFNRRERGTQTVGKSEPASASDLWERGGRMVTIIHSLGGPLDSEKCAPIKNCVSHYLIVAVSDARSSVMQATVCRESPILSGRVRRRNELCACERSTATLKANLIKLNKREAQLRHDGSRSLPQSRVGSS